jgi:hypothetical protein
VCQTEQWYQRACLPACSTAAQGGGDERIAEVGALLEEAAGTVRIEDILPLFPDFVEIGAFKDAICRWWGVCTAAGPLYAGQNSTYVPALGGLRERAYPRLNRWLVAALSWPDCSAA